MRSFWQKLKRPIIALAPMANVTDAAFRRIIAKYGKPDVMWTEFVSCDGICAAVLPNMRFRGRFPGLCLLDRKENALGNIGGYEKLLIDLKFSPKERPIVAQFFGVKPENFYKCARLAQKLGFDGIDINMGCPDKAVERQGAGAALMKNPKLAQEIILAAKRGSGGLPVSVKTRIGYAKNELKTWLPALLKTEPAAVILHLRTRKEMSDAPAHWEAFGEAVRIRNKLKSKTLILGNGDIRSLAEAKEKAKKYGADGVMIGRGVFGNPWFFSEKSSQITVAKKLKAMLEHAKLFRDVFKIDSKTGRGLKNYDNMKKHYKAYVSGFDGAKELRIKLMNARNYEEAKEAVKTFLKKERIK